MKVTLTTVLVFFLFLTSYSQLTVANDSVETGTNDTAIVFYSLTTGAKKVVSNTDWHVAVSVRPTQYPNNTLGGTTVRINEAFGVYAYQIPYFTADSANATVDTTGYHQWHQIHDSDTLLDLGAFNDGYDISQFFYGWGKYSGQPLHNVNGKKVYLLELPNGAVKKFFINRVIYDTAWLITYSNIDNSNQQTFSISKYAYPHKELVYLNLYDNSVKDKEPVAADWDLAFLKYAAADVYPGLVHPTTGVWTNQSGSVAKATGADAFNNSVYTSLNYSADLNAIGWNWKDYDSLLTYTVRDSLAYFVHTNNNNYYKIIFTAYGGSANGRISFNGEFVAGNATAIKETVENNISLYPNPTANQLTIQGADVTVKEVTVFDMLGNRLIAYNAANQNNTLNIDVSSLQSGAYILQLKTADGVSSNQKFLVAR